MVFRLGGLGGLCWSTAFGRSSGVCRAGSTIVATIPCPFSAVLETRCFGIGIPTTFFDFLTCNILSRLFVTPLSVASRSAPALVCLLGVLAVACQFLACRGTREVMLTSDRSGYADHQDHRGEDRDCHEFLGCLGRSFARRDHRLRRLRVSRGSHSSLHSPLGRLKGSCQLCCVDGRQAT